MHQSILFLTLVFSIILYLPRIKIHIASSLFSHPFNSNQIWPQNVSRVRSPFVNTLYNQFNSDYISVLNITCNYNFRPKWFKSEQVNGLSFSPFWVTSFFVKSKIDDKVSLDNFENLADSWSFCYPFRLTRSHKLWFFLFQRFSVFIADTIQVYCLLFHHFNDITLCYSCSSSC